MAKKTNEKIEHTRAGFYQKLLKRIIDFILVILTVPLTLPLFIVVAILVRFKIGKPIFFVQKRPGLNEKPFQMVKFRTMTDQRDENGDLLEDRARLVPFGRFLRSTSLDELPELWNVLKGEMAIVGPRPLLMSYLPLYSSTQRKRHSVRPGVTGLAQVMGRNLLTWDEKFSMDVQYVDNVSLLNDVRILLRTIKVILFREGISADNSETMPAFEGNEKSD